ncbi:M50 family metallopeptidase [Serinibacter arcticus]|uniref:M50 family metallopeptidase n=1 Tax=Serinibacter arcticus TaxID=1655435 RepID=UPI001F484910|nr:M50 family metallopeptidase [Serinibacter arcticus]
MVSRWPAALPWADATWWVAIVERTRRASEGWTAYGPGVDASFDGTPAWQTWLPLAIAVAVVVVPLTWRLVRIGVTWVHELGHAAVGILVGRRFTGFVVRGDMSGHAVTVGKPRGPGLAWTTWAGYPAPAVVGAGLVAAAVHGWAPAVLGALGALAVVTLVFVRSWSTAGTTLAVALTAGALWWWRSDGRSSAVVLAAGLVLILGAWRHLAAVAGSPRDSDPAVLARSTRVPGWFWIGTFGLVIAGATALAGWLLWGALR